MADLEELLQQKQALELQIKEARQTAIADAVAEVRGIIAKYDLTDKDIFLTGRRGMRRGAGARASTGKVPPKYRDPVTGQTWTGRGKAPRWIDGKDRTQYLIAD